MRSMAFCKRLKDKYYAGDDEMRVILSRKGFDSGNGGMPSPIMPDGTLLSLPIPSEAGNVTYHDIMFRGRTYYDIIQELSPAAAKRIENSKCHIDPDLECYYQNMPGWKPAFGQCGLSQRHLKKHNVGVGDVFLFYGWFRQTEYDTFGKLRFVKNGVDKTPDRHVIYGYMEIGDVLTEQSAIDREYPWHPHAERNMLDNVLYVPKDRFSLDEQKKGYGILKNASIRQLTKPGHKRSEWLLPDCLRESEITFHEGTSYGWIKGTDYFRSARIGQEFIVKEEVTGKLAEWLLSVISQ